MLELAVDRGDGDAVLVGLRRALRELTPAADDAARVDQIRVLEEIKSAAAAAQAAVTAAFCASQRAEQLAAGVPAERADRGVAAQVGLAKRTSPFRARRYVGWAKILTSELPGTFAALRRGEIPEWRAMLVARETAWLSRADRALADAELAPRLEQLGDKRTAAEAKKIGYRLDPSGFVDRLRNAETERRVTLRPEPDVMCRLSALLPVARGVAGYAALCREADARRAAGDSRSRGQVMADTLVERLTGQSVADGVPIEVNLVMPADSLLPTAAAQPADTGAAAADPAGPKAAHRDTGADPHETGPETRAEETRAAEPPAGGRPGDEPAHLDGYGPVPAAIARDWLLDPARTAPTWIRRLYAHPRSGDLIAMDSRRRTFTAGQRRFLRLRDQLCRTPWCEAPIRHFDHVTPAEQGGPTSTRNGQGSCEGCNYDKQAPGWYARSDPDGSITRATPTGHEYVSSPPSRGTSPARGSPTRLTQPAGWLVIVDYVHFAA